MITIQVCNVCKCAEIQRKEWVEINSGKSCGIVGDDNDKVWCPDCEEHVKFKDFNIKQS